MGWRFSSSQWQGGMTVMVIAQRSAETTWEGSLPGGTGIISPASAAMGPLPVTWASRTEAPGGKTSPEELVAAAHSACFAMALALRLGERKAIPRRLSVTAIVSSDLRVRGQVPDLDAAGFQDAVNEAAELCPVSRLLAGAEIRVVDAALEPAR